MQIIEYNKLDELIKNGKGIISVPEKHKVEFGTKLISYYEDENTLEII